ncbi:MAG: cation:dicarboxylase symporter family transporter [Rectinemataceae bacterium]
MKLWLKYLIGILLGVLLFLVLPDGAGADGGTVAFLADLGLRIAGYVVVLLLFFGIPVAICEFFEDGIFWRSFGKTVLLYAIGAALFSAVGAAITWAFSPIRVPLLADIAAEPATGFQDSILRLFPADPSRIFSDAATSLAPLLLFAFVLGIAFSHDRVMTRPAVTFFDSMHHVFYQISTFLAETMGILLIPISVAAAYRMEGIIDKGFYGHFLLLLAGEILFAALAVIPLILYFLGGRKNPYPTIYAFLGPALVAMVSGDLKPAAGLISKHGRESLGISRRTDSLVMPLGLTIGRAGTALVTASAFVAILSSYSSLGTTLPNMLRLLFIVPVAVLFAGSGSGAGPLMALATTCSLFGKGFENGHLVIVPLAFPLAAAGSFLDALWIGAATAIRARKDGSEEAKPIRHHI